MLAIYLKKHRNNFDRLKIFFNFLYIFIGEKIQKLFQYWFKTTSFFIEI